MGLEKRGGNQLIIIGGGTSIKEGIEKGLWERLIDRFTISLNFNYHHFPYHTFCCYVDKDFYIKNIEGLKVLPLVVGKYHKQIKAEGNLIQLKTNESEYDPSLKKGVYKSSLVGLFSLTVGSYLLEEGEVFLLGYDFGAVCGIDKKNRPMTHYYQEENKLNHRGIGKINYYQSKGRADRDFKVYNNPKIKIYNVSLNSNIDTFEKISYDQFFGKLNNIRYDQNELRSQIRQKMLNLNQE